MIDKMLNKYPDNLKLIEALVSEDDFPENTFINLLEKAIATENKKLFSALSFYSKKIPKNYLLKFPEIFKNRLFSSGQYWGRMELFNKFPLTTEQFILVLKEGDKSDKDFVIESSFGDSIFIDNIKPEILEITLLYLKDKEFNILINKLLTNPKFYKIISSSIYSSKMLQALDEENISILISKKEYLYYHQLAKIILESPSINDVDLLDSYKYLINKNQILDFSVFPKEKAEKLKQLLCILDILE